MRNIRIGFSASSGLVGWLIRKLDHSDVNHCFFLVDVDGRDMVIGADGNGFVMQSYQKFLAGRTVVDLFGSEVLSVNLDSGSGFLLDSLDQGYDYEGLGGMLFVEVARWFHRKVRNPFGSVSKLFCSEAGAEMLQHVGLAGAAYLDAASTSPGMLRDFLVHRREASAGALIPERRTAARSFQ
jgi:hypothetical protein